MARVRYAGPGLGLAVLLMLGQPAVAQTAEDYGPGPFTHDCFTENWPKETFVAERWRDVPKGQRYRFVRTLLDSHILKERKREYIIDLLGEPDGNYKEYMTYIIREFDPLGCIHGFLALLHFDLNAEDVVERVWIRLD